MGIDDFVVLDRGNDLGGTWRDNSYPGAACDVPVEPLLVLLRPQPGLDPLLPPAGARSGTTCAHCVDRFEVGDHLRFGRAVDEARWDDEAERWVVRTRRRARSTARPVLVWATGSLSEPSIPDFPGLDDFRGKVFHSARWEHGFDLTGKRVCVVGTGASAVQFVPQIAPVVEHLYLHQRTPPWIVPRRDRPVSRLRKARLPQGARRPAPVPAAHLRHSSSRCSRSSSARATRRKAAVRKAALDHLARQVPDEALRADAHPALRAGLQAPAALRRLLPLAHPAQRRGGRLAGGVLHRARGRRPGRHRPPGRRGDHGHRLRGGRAALRRAHRGPGRRPALRASGRPTASRPTPAPPWPGSRTSS